MFRLVPLLKSRQSSRSICCALAYTIACYVGFSVGLGGGTTTPRARHGLGRPCRARFLQSELAPWGRRPASCNLHLQTAVGMVCVAWLLACPAANTDMRKILLSGSWPPRPPQPPSPHAVLLVVPGMKSSVAVARNVVNSVEHMGGQARLDPGPHSRASPL